MSSNNNLNKGRLYYANRKGACGGHGFNCWGATLFVLGVSKRLKWVWAHNMDKWLEESTEHVEGLHKIGDILVLRSHGELEHTAVLMGVDRYFHKRGSNSSEITSLEGIFVTYHEHYQIEYRRMK